MRYATLVLLLCLPACDLWEDITKGAGDDTGSGDSGTCCDYATGETF